MFWIEVHLVAIVCAALSGAWVIFTPKGTTRHKQLGRCYVLGMVTASVSSLFLPAAVGPQIILHFGFIHLLSVFVLLSVPLAVVAVRRGNVNLHRRLMVGNFIGGVLVAGTFALIIPGRLLHQYFF